MSGMGKPGDQQTWVYQTALDAWLAGATGGGSGNSTTSSITTSVLLPQPFFQKFTGSLPSLTGSSNWTVLFNLPFYVTGTLSQINLYSSVAAGKITNIATNFARIVVDGVEVLQWAESNNAGYAGSTAGVFSMTASAGSHVASLQVRCDTTGLELLPLTAPQEHATLLVQEAINSIAIAASFNQSISASTQIKYHDTTYGPIGLWSLSGTLNDSGALAQNMVTNGGTTRYTNMGPGLRGIMLDGSTILGLTASLPFSAITVLTGALTWEGMLIVEPPGASETIWTSSGLSGDVNGSENELFGININTNGTLLTSWETNVGVNQGPTTTTVTVPFNRLFHLAVSRDASGICKTYIDGALMEVSTTNTMPNTGTVAVSSARYSIGAFPGSTFGTITQGVSNVSMASVKVVPRVLTDGEVAAEYNRTLGALYSNVAAVAGLTDWVVNSGKMVTSDPVSIDGQSRSVDQIGSDVYFYVSGTTGSPTAPKRSVFGGDVVVSGSLLVGGVAAGAVTFASRLTALDSNHIHAWEMTELTSSVYSDTGNTSFPCNLNITNGGGLIQGVPGLLGPCAFNNSTGGTYASTADLSASLGPGTDFPTGSNPFTLECWYRSDSRGSLSQFLWVSDYSNGGSFSCALYPDSSNTWSVFVQPNGPFTTFNTPPTPQEGIWTYVVETFDGSVYRVYINGIIMTTTAGGKAAPGWYTNGSSPRYFGLFGTKASTGNPLRGCLSRVRMSNIARTQAYISAVYNKAMLTS